MKKFLQDFKAFAMKGNVVDMAVGVIIGGAFGKIVTSLVNDIIMPPIGVLLGNKNFSDLAVTLKAARPEVLDEMGAVIETWKEVRKVGYYESIDVMASSGDKSKTITCDAWKNPEDAENITIVKGSIPKYENEVIN